MTDYQLPPCNIRIYLKTRYGITCAENENMTWDDCESKCRLAADCPECEKPRILSYDPCAGRIMLCLNPDCGMDK